MCRWVFFTKTSTGEKLYSAHEPFGLSPDISMAEAFDDNVGITISDWIRELNDAFLQHGYKFRSESIAIDFRSIVRQRNKIAQVVLQQISDLEYAGTYGHSTQVSRAVTELLKYLVTGPESRQVAEVFAMTVDRNARVTNRAMLLERQRRAIWGRVDWDQVIS